MSTIVGTKTWTSKTRFSLATAKYFALEVKDQGHKRIVPREVFQKAYRQKVAYKYVDDEIT